LFETFRSRGLLSACGFGFYWSWLLISFNSAALGSGDQGLSAATTTLSMCFYLVLVVFRLLALAASRTLNPLLLNRRILLGASLLLSFSSLTIILFYKLTPGAFASILMVLGVLMCALGSLWLTSAWLEDLRRHQPFEVFFLATGGFFVAGLLSIIPIIASPLPAIVCMLTFPVIAGLLLSASLRRSTDSTSTHNERALARRRAEGDASTSDLRRRIVAACVGILFVGLVGTMVIAFRDEEQALGNANLFDLLNSLGIILFSVMLLILAAFLMAPKVRGNLPPLALSRVILIAIALALTLPAVLPQLPFASANLLLSGGMCGFEILLVFYSVEFSRFFRVSVFVSLGVTFGLMELVRALGQPLSHAIVTVIEAQRLDWSVIALGLLIALMLVALFLIMPSVDFFNRAFSKRRDLDTSGQTAALDRLAQSCGLTPRERDVALLLYRGRSLPWIQKNLNISLSTAQTHTRHIYEKLEVHSRQEFLSVIEEEGSLLDDRLND
jgi:DNA-binding CsgD family transcriptional regulator